MDGRQWSGPEAGRPAVLLFWSASCGHCIEEVVKLTALQQETGASLSCFGFPLQRDVEVAARVAAGLGVQWPQLRGSTGTSVNPLALALGVHRLPSLWLVDDAGAIRAAQLSSVEEVRTRLPALLTGQ